MLVRYPVSIPLPPHRTIHPLNRSNLHTPTLIEARMTPHPADEDEDETPEYPLPSPTNPLNPDLIESNPDGEPDIGALPDNDNDNDNDSEQPEPG